MNWLLQAVPSRQRGAALIIVLAFVVLLTGLGVAYLSRTTSDRQIAHSSFNQSKADELAQSAIDLSFCVSFAGNLTFKNAASLREVARQLPLDRLLIETDCPYLTPVPFRGRRNEPARVIETARCLAEVHGEEFEEIGRITSENFARLLRSEAP